MAARRSSEGMQRAVLGLGEPDDRDTVIDDTNFVFYDMTYPLYTRGWLEHKTVQADCFYLPTIRGELLRDEDPWQCRFHFSFMWSDPSQDTEMTVEDACLALEHYFTWV